MANKIPDKIVWDADEFLFHPKSFVWYVAFFIFSAGLITYAIFSKSILTIVTFALVIISAFVFSRRKPRVIRHEIGPTGIILGDTEYPYKNIKKFWIIYEPPAIKTINIETTAYVNPHIAIQLGDQDPMPVKLLLRKFLPEDLDKEEAFTDTLARRIKF
jgi:hypothetical protein